MHDIIPTNRKLRNYKYIYNKDNKNKELNGIFTITTSSGYTSVQNMFDNNNDTFWESEDSFIEKIDDPSTSNSLNDLTSEPCTSDDYLSGTCTNRYTGFNKITGYTKYLSNDPSGNNLIIENKINTTIKGETIDITLPNPYYIYEINMEFVEGHIPKRYMVYAYDEEIRKYVLLGVQFNISHIKKQDNLPFYPNKKYKRIIILFNALSENPILKISKLQLKGDNTLKTAHNSKYTLDRENFSNIKKKVRFSDTKYVYEYENTNINYIDLLIPLGLTSALFFVYLNKKI